MALEIPPEVDLCGVDLLAVEGEDLRIPDNTTPVARTITNACVTIPVEVPGVIGVSAVGNDPQAPRSYLKSFYSSYGVSATQLTAPRGDSVFGRTPQAPNGRVLSTYPPYRPCVRSVQEPVSDPNEPTAFYCYLHGTSMASPARRRYRRADHQQIWPSDEPAEREDATRSGQGVPRPDR
jgi:hypothetical protein